DKNGNCEEEGGISTPLAGVQLILKDATGTTIASTQTNAAGEYEFTNILLPGTYSVVEFTPAGLLDGDEHVGTINGVHVGVATNDDLGGIVLTGGQNGINYDFCEILPASIAGRVFFDPNEDCVFDENDQPLSGVTVQLLNAQGTVIQTTQTDANGEYRFDNLLPGMYSVRELQPQGYLQ